MPKKITNFSEFLNSFVKRKLVVRMLGPDYQLSEFSKNELRLIFNNKDTFSINDWLSTIVTFIQNNLDNYYGRIQKLKSLGNAKTSLEYFITQHGITIGKALYEKNNIKNSQRNTGKLKKYRKINIRDEFIKTHGDFYDYTKVDYNGPKQKITIICLFHGEFDQKPFDHINGAGCPECGKIRRNRKNSLGEKIIINRFIRKFKNRFDYSLVKCNKTHDKITVICKEHGSFITTPAKHLRQSSGNCPLCMDELKIKNAHQNIKEHNTTNKLTLEKFIIQATDIHEQKFDYSSIISIDYYDQPVSIYCNDHDILFFQRAGYHLSGSGCPKCQKFKAENEWLDYCGVPNHPEYRRVRLYYTNNGKKKYFVLDGFIKETNTIYEFWGDYYHGNPLKHHPDDFNNICQKSFGALYNETAKKIEIIKSLNYNLVEIWESEWNNIKKNL